MHEEIQRADLKQNTQQLLDGPLKHVRAAALAAALVPLASLVATPANAQAVCASGGVCGLVFNDANHNGIQDAGETGLPGVKVTVSDGTTTVTTETGPDGSYILFGLPDGTYTISVQTPVGYTTSPPNVCCDDSVDSDGIPDGLGNSVATGVVVVAGSADTDFGFFTKQVLNPGTGTLGYWKNHPDAWPASSITVGGVTYTKDQAVYWMQRVGKDKSTLMFAQLVAAMLNVTIGNDSSCVSSTISAANDWMAVYGPVGSNLPASSDAWRIGDPIAAQLDAYNNGRLCAPHRK